LDSNQPSYILRPVNTQVIFEFTINPDQRKKHKKETPKKSKSPQEAKKNGDASIK
jgi:hypothetical protein